jgi:hypothetical protein
MKFCRLQPAAKEKMYMQKRRVADPHHFNVDSGPAFHLTTDTDQHFQFNANPDSDSAPHPATTPFCASTALHGSTVGLESS